MYETISPRRKTEQKPSTIDLAEFKTILDVLRFGISLASQYPLFYGHGCDTVEDDIWALILGSLQLPADCDPILLHGRLTQDEKAYLAKQLAARIWDKRPVPYLTNRAFFAGLSFYVDERVLIPRSPIAELIKEHFAPWVHAPEAILDMCTGSGAIAIACQYAFPEAKVVALDVSKEALQVARVNCERHGLEEVIELVESDCWKNLPHTRYDIIVSNPPYVGNEEMDTLPMEYRHEPDLALRSTNNGLGIVERILTEAHRYLTKSGILVVEVGNSEEALKEAYPEVPFTWIDFEHGGHGVFVLTAQQLQEYWLK